MNAWFEYETVGAGRRMDIDVAHLDQRGTAYVRLFAWCLRLCLCSALLSSGGAYAIDVTLPPYLYDNSAPQPIDDQDHPSYINDSSWMRFSTITIGGFCVGTNISEPPDGGACKVDGDSYVYVPFKRSASGTPIVLKIQIKAVDTTTASTRKCPIYIGGASCFIGGSQNWMGWAQFLSVHVDASELAKLAHAGGGVWQARPIMGVQEATKDGTYRFQGAVPIIITVAPLPPIAVVLGSKDLLLSVSPGPGPNPSTGTDLCFFDGTLDGKAGKLNLKLFDNVAESSHDPSDRRRFALGYGGNIKPTEGDRLDYTVSLPELGLQNVTRNQAYPLNVSESMSTTLTQPIPFGDGSVTPAAYTFRCVPSRLELRAASVGLGAKRAGRYSGTLTLRYGPGA